MTKTLDNSLNAWGSWIVSGVYSESKKILNSSLVALTSDVAANFLIWSAGFGPAYYGWKCVGFTFVNATFKYYIREKINDYFNNYHFNDLFDDYCYDYYYSKHLIAGAIGGGSYYGANYLFKVYMEGIDQFRASKLIGKVINGAFNNSIWEFSSESLKSTKEQGKWLEYSTQIYNIESFDCAFDDLPFDAYYTTLAKCIFIKQPVGALSRTIGAFIREKLTANGNNAKKANYTDNEDAVLYENIIDKSQVKEESNSTSMIYANEPEVLNSDNEIVIRESIGKSQDL